jgi:hypothetical protein
LRSWKSAFPFSRRLLPAFSTKVALEGGRKVKFIYQELAEDEAFIAAQI